MAYYCSSCGIRSTLEPGEIVFFCGTCVHETYLCLRSVFDVSIVFMLVHMRVTRHDSNYDLMHRWFTQAVEGTIVR